MHSIFCLFITMKKILIIFIVAKLIKRFTSTVCINIWRALDYELHRVKKLCITDRSTEIGPKISKLCSGYLKIGKAIKNWKSKFSQIQNVLLMNIKGKIIYITKIFNLLNLFMITFLNFLKITNNFLVRCHS